MINSFDLSVNKLYDKIRVKNERIGQEKEYRRIHREITFSYNESKYS